MSKRISMKPPKSIKSGFEPEGNPEYNPFFSGAHKPGCFYWAGYWVDKSTPWIVFHTLVDNGEIIIDGAFATEEEAKNLFEEIDGPYVEIENLENAYSDEIESSRQIKSSRYDDSKLYTVEEFVNLISADYQDKEDFIDWVKEGIHGSDKLSVDRWMEQWNEYQPFTRTEDSTDEDTFTVYTDDKEITVRKEDDHKWHGSDGKTFMGYLKPQDVLHWYRQDYGDAWIDSSRQNVSKKPIKSALDTVKVTFDNGDVITTDYNADVGREEITKYYMGHYFNIGSEDEMHKVIKVEFPDSITSSQKGWERVAEGTQYDDYYVDTRGMGINHVGDIIEAIERRGNQAVLTVQCSDGSVQHTYFPLKAWKEYKDTKNNYGVAVTDVWITEVEGGSYVINSRKIESSTSGVLDEHDAEDLEPYAENTAEIYHRFITPTRNNLRKKVQNGTYDENKALKAWENVIDEAAKMYDKELGSGRGSMTLFNKSTRHEAAKRLMERMDDDVFQGLRKIESCRKPRRIKSAVSYGWEVTSSDAPKALDMWVEYTGEENALEDIAQAQGTDSLSENIEYIARNFDVSDTIEQADDVWEKHELLRELLGVHTYLQNLTAAMGYDELAECLVEIFRMNDFRDWDEREVFSNRKITSGKRTVDHTKPSREEVEKELDKHLAKAKVTFSKEMYDQTVDYILSFWDEIDYLPKSVYEAVHEWYLDTKQNFPEMLKPGKQQVASSAYRRFITSSRRRR